MMRVYPGQVPGQWELIWAPLESGTGLGHRGFWGGAQGSGRASQAPYESPIVVIPHFVVYYLSLGLQYDNTQ